VYIWRAEEKGTWQGTSGQQNEEEEEGGVELDELDRRIPTCDSRIYVPISAAWNATTTTTTTYYTVKCESDQQTNTLR